MWLVHVIDRKLRKEERSSNLLVALGFLRELASLLGNLDNGTDVLRSDPCATMSAAAESNHGSRISHKNRGPTGDRQTLPFGPYQKQQHCAISGKRTSVGA